MANIYVDLDISTSGATGTVGDPLGYDEWKTHIEVPSGIATAYLLKGKHTYSYTSVSDKLTFAVKPSVIVDNWILSDPARITIGSDFLPAIEAGFTIEEGFVLTINGILIDILAGFSTVFRGGTDLRVFRCYIKRKANQFQSNFGVSFFSNGLNNASLTVKACSLVVPATSNSVVFFTISFNVFSAGETFHTVYTIEENVIQAGIPSFHINNKNIFKVGVLSNTSASGIFRYNSFSGVANNASDFSITENNNISTITPQIPVVDVINSNIKADILPAAGSPILNAGNPNSLVAADIVGDIRTFDPNPDIGCTEGAALQTFYVDLSISTSGANGSEIDPLGYDEFKIYLNLSSSIPENFLLKNEHTYAYLTTSDFIVIGNKSDLTTIKNWIPESPARITIVTGISGTYFGAILISSGVLFDGILIQDDTEFLSMFSSSRELFVINCYFIKKLGLSNFTGASSPYDTADPTIFLMPSSTGVWTKGSDILFGQGSIDCSIITINTFSIPMGMDSCYLGSGSSSSLSLGQELNNFTTINGVVKFSGAFGINAGFGGGSNVSVSNSIAGVPLQKTEVTVATANIKNDILPIAASPLINAGNPNPSFFPEEFFPIDPVLKDIVNEPRVFDPNPDIGSTESTIILPPLPKISVRVRNTQFDGTYEIRIP